VPRTPERPRKPAFHGQREAGSRAARTHLRAWLQRAYRSGGLAWWRIAARGAGLHDCLAALEGLAGERRIPAVASFDLHSGLQRIALPTRLRFPRRLGLRGRIGHGLGVAAVFGGGPSAGVGGAVAGADGQQHRDTKRNAPVSLHATAGLTGGRQRSTPRSPSSEHLRPALEPGATCPGGPSTGEPGTAAPPGLCQSRRRSPRTATRTASRVRHRGPVSSWGRPGREPRASSCRWPRPQATEATRLLLPKGPEKPGGARGSRP